MFSKIPLIILFLLPMSVAGQNSEDIEENYPSLIIDWKVPVTPNASQTFEDLLRQEYSSVQFNPRSQLVEVGQDWNKRIVDKGQGFWFDSDGKQYLVLLVYLQNPFPIRSLRIFSSKLILFRLENSRLKLLDRMTTEISQPTEPTADFYYDALSVPISDGKNAVTAVTILTTKTYHYEHKRVQKFRLFTVKNNRLKIVLDDSPELIATNKCGEYKYENEQSLVAITPKELRRGNRFTLEIMTQEYFTTNDNCQDVRANRKIILYEAVWNRRRGQYQTRFKSVEIEWLKEKPGH